MGEVDERNVRTPREGDRQDEVADDEPQVIRLDELAEDEPKVVHRRLARLDDWTSEPRRLERRGPITDRLARVNLDEDAEDAD